MGEGDGSRTADSGRTRGNAPIPAPPGHVIRVHDDPRAIDAAAWNRLLEASDEPTPFMRHEYLAALQASGSAVAATGWACQFLTIEAGGELRAAVPLYLKSHSYGEFVFDWAWAEAYRRHGLRYYPKILAAVPFTPVPGTRLLAADAAARAALARALAEFGRDSGLSSAHLLFCTAAEQALFTAADGSTWMPRGSVQFHWQQDAIEPVPDFTALLARMQRDKRKKIQQERRRVAEAGVVFSVHEGSSIDEPLWDFFYLCHQRTYAAHGGGTPYLTREFFRAMARTMPENWVMFVARRGDAAGAPIACSLVAVDRARGSAWGRYWGCTEPVSCLHFEACYYQPLAWCLASGMRRFEGGAQGEHKMARGLLPVLTRSVHWLRDDRFAAAVGDFLEREGEGVAGYVDELRERNPFKAGRDG